MSVFTPTKRNEAHAAAKEIRAALAGAVREGLDTMSPASAVAATLSTDLAGSNNDLVFTAKSTGVAGNRISIAYVDPEEETAEESVAVKGTDIIVTLRSVSTTLSTAAQVKAAIDGDTAAAALVAVANKAANNGTGNVIGMAATRLTGGSEAKSVIEQLSGEMGVSEGEAVRKTSATALDLEDAMQVVQAFDETAYTAFAEAIDATLTARAPTPPM